MEREDSVMSLPGGGGRGGVGLLTGAGDEDVSWPEATPMTAVAKGSNENSVLVDFMDPFPLRLAWAIVATLMTASVFVATPPAVDGNLNDEVPLFWVCIRYLFFFFFQRTLELVV